MKSRSNLHVWYIWLVYILASSHPHIFRFLCTCLYPRILISLCSCVLACILASLHPHIFRFICPCLHPWILISSGSCVLACILAFSHTYIPKFICVSLYPHIFMCACLYPCIRTSSCPQVHVRLLVSSHPHILVSSGLCVLANISYPKVNVFLIRMNNCILASSGSLVFGNCVSQFVNNLQILWTGQAFVLDFYCTNR